MHYSIYETGTLIASYENEGDAIDALVTLSTEQPARAEGLVFVAFNDEGERIGSPVFGSYFCAD